MKKQIQQGDVLAVQVPELPAGAKRVPAKDGIYVIAEGEATGHMHVVPDIVDVDLFEHDGVLYLMVGADVQLAHVQGLTGQKAEHEPVTVPPGMWEVGQVVEVDPFEGEIRTVVD